MKKNSVMQGTVKKMPLKMVTPDPEQPRQSFDDTALKQLSDSISDKGMMHPITVEPKLKGKYMIVDGERRFRAAKRLGLTSVPVNVLSKSLDEAERNIIRFQIQENHQQWSVFEKAEAMYALKNALGLSTAELARSLSIIPSTAQNYMNALSFPKKERRLAIEMKIPFVYIMALSNMQNIMPKEIEKDYPDYLVRVLKKYKAGYIRNDKELRVINRLIKAGAYDVIRKFFKKLDYTAIQAEMDSDYVKDRHVDSVINRAKCLLRDIRVLKKNKLKVNKIGTAVFDELVEEILSV